MDRSLGATRAATGVAAADRADALHGRVQRIEALIHQDVGRNATALFAATAGGLWNAASAIARLPAPRIGVLTGFYVPTATPPAAETDGPAGMALLVRGLSNAGLYCRVLTDDPCQSSCRAALAGAEMGAVALDSVVPDAPMAPAIQRWRDAGIDWAIAIERCGRTADGTPRNMRGVDMQAWTAPLDEVFQAGPWATMAIGDGGNEIGLGSLPASLIARHVDRGALIACVTPATHLVMAGVSHWGAYALLGALALLRPDWRDALLACLDPELDTRILDRMVRDGPAVDGVSQRQALTIDTLPLSEHHARLQAIRAVVEAPA